MIENAKLQEWFTRLTHAQAGHYRQSEFYGWVNLVIGLPLIIISTFISTVLFIDPKIYNSMDSYARAAGVLVAVLASIQTFVRPSDKAEQHRSKAAKYGTLKRKLEFFMVLDSQNQSPKDFMYDFQIAWDNIAEDSPTTPQRVRERVKKIIDTNFRSKSVT